MKKLMVSLLCNMYFERQHFCFAQIFGSTGGRRINYNSFDGHLQAQNILRLKNTSHQGKINKKIIYVRVSLDLYKYNSSSNSTLKQAEVDKRVIL